MERVKSWDWSMLVLALGIGAMGVKLLLAKPDRAEWSAPKEIRGSTAAATGVPLTPRLLSLLSDADR